jgi:hypothetical protein
VHDVTPLEKLAAMVEQFYLYGGIAELNEWRLPPVA